MITIALGIILALVILCAIGVAINFIEAGAKLPGFIILGGVAVALLAIL